MKALIISLAFLLIVSAQSASGQNEKNAPQTAIKLANAVMARHDSFIRYNNHKSSHC